MSEAHETSYYEIALTSRQAFTAFVLLLVCMVAAFFAGLWVGKGAVTEASLLTEERVADRGEESPLEELRFFSEQEDGDATPGPAKNSPPPAAKEGSAPTLLDQLAGEPAATKPPSTKPSRRQRAKGRRAKARPPTDEAAEPTRPQPTASEPPPPDEPTPEPKPKTPEPKPVSAETESNPEEMIIQVFSSSDRTQATRVFDRLKADGYAAFVEPIQEAGQTLYRVRIGPFANRDAAEPVAAEVRRKHRLDTWITRAGG